MGLMFVIEGGIYALTAPVWGYLCDRKVQPKVNSVEFITNFEKIKLKTIFNQGRYLNWSYYDHHWFSSNRPSAFFTARYVSFGIVFCIFAFILLYYICIYNFITINAGR